MFAQTLAHGLRKVGADLLFDFQPVIVAHADLLARVLGVSNGAAP